VELSNVSVRVEAGEEVKARYMPATTERRSGGYEMDYPEWLSLWFGNVSIAGRPAVVVELLGRALREAYAACGAGNPDGPDDCPSGPALAVVPKGGER
jgi:hypothetical protein